MPNRLNLPDDLDSLIEKRELEHRRQADRERAAREKDGYHVTATDEEPAPPVPRVPVDRRKSSGRRKGEE